MIKLENELFVNNKNVFNSVMIIVSILNNVSFVMFFMIN